MKQMMLSSTLVMLSFLLAACSGNEAKETEIVRPAIAVKAELVKTETIEITKSYSGSLKGEKQTTIYSKVSEAVESIGVNEGDRVQENQVLISLDKTGSSSNYLQAKELFLNSKKNFEKMEYLYNEGAVSELDFDAAETDYKVKKASFDAASKLVEIVSPISGIVTSVEVSEGDFVMVGERLITIAKSERLRATFDVNPNEINLMQLHSPVSVAYDNSENRISGKIVTIASSADPVNRAFKVEALIENPENMLKPGMFVNIDYVTEKLNDVLLIPRKAVQIRNDKNMVFVASNGKAFLREVELGVDTNGDIVVHAGLQKSDTLITIGQEYLEDSADIRITELN